MRNERNSGATPPIFTEREFDDLVDRIGATYQDRTGVNLQEMHNLPGQREVFGIIAKLLEVIFPGFSEAPRHHDSLNAETAALLSELRNDLFDQVLRAVRYGGGDGVLRKPFGACGGRPRGVGGGDERMA